MTTAIFGAESTTDEVLDGFDLSGAWALVTGASAGLGQETARALAAHGANVVMGVRDLKKGEAAAAAVRAAATNGATIELLEVDLANLASVRAATDRFLDDHDHLDLLIDNAGLMACPQGTTDNGFELQFGTNHLGHFVFTNRLAPALLAGAPSRVIVLTSAGHRFSPVDLDDPSFERNPYDAWAAYGRAKSANALFAVELDRRLSGRGVRAASVHPGAIITELGRHLTEETLSSMRTSFADRKVVWKSIPQGGATSVWAAVRADAAEMGGRYCEDCHVAHVSDDEVFAGGVRSYAIDPEIAQALWTRSEELVGESFPLG